MRLRRRPTSGDKALKLVALEALAARDRWRYYWLLYEPPPPGSIGANLSPEDRDYVVTRERQLEADPELLAAYQQRVADEDDDARDRHRWEAGDQRATPCPVPRCRPAYGYEGWAEVLGLDPAEVEAHLASIRGW